MILPARLRCLSALALLCGCAMHAPAQTAEAIAEYSDQGQKALAQGKYAEAEAAFEKLRELEPGVAEVHANLGVIYFQERKFEQAVPALRQALKLKPALTKTAALLAISLSELGRYGEALPGPEKGFSPVYRPSHQAHVRPTVAQGLHRTAARQQCGGSSPGAESALSQ